jgi:hypothetical protein
MEMNRRAGDSPELPRNLRRAEMRVALQHDQRLVAGDGGHFQQVEVLLDEAAGRFVTQIVEVRFERPARRTASRYDCFTESIDTGKIGPLRERGRVRKTSMAPEDSGTSRAVPFLVIGMCATRSLRSMCFHSRPMISESRMPVSIAIGAMAVSHGIRHWAQAARSFSSSPGSRRRWRPGRP